jgi:positive regulator of sigma E activity
MQIGRHKVRIGRREFQILFGAMLLLATRLLFDIASISAYVYPEHDFGQAFFALPVFFVALLGVFVFAMVRLFQRRIIESVTLLAILYIPFSFNEIINRHYWKFQRHKSEYQSIIQADPSPPPRYHLFNWGNRNTTLGGGIIVDGVVYDESDEIARKSESRSAEWIERRSNPAPPDRWVTEFPLTNPPCRRRIEPYDEHFYYLAVEC